MTREGNRSAGKAQARDVPMDGAESRGRAPRKVVLGSRAQPARMAAKGRSLTSGRSQTDGSLSRSESKRANPSRAAKRIGQKRRFESMDQNAGDSDVPAELVVKKQRVGQAKDLKAKAIRQPKR